MKIKVFALLTVIVLCLSMVLPVSAADTHIYDPTNTLTDISTLESYAQKIEDKYGYSVLFSIVDNVGTEGTYAYCEDLYIANANEKNGIALTYNYGENKYSFYCAGEAEKLFPVDVQSDTLWYAYAYAETSYDGVYAYLVAVETILSKSVNTSAPVETTGSQNEPTTEFVPVERTLSLVVDNADVLTPEEEANLLAKVEALGTANDMEIGVITVDSYDGKDPQAFADDFYDYNGYGYGENDDGLIVVFNTGEGDGNRNIAISTHGTAIKLVSDNDIALIIETMINPIKNGDFVGAFDKFVEECENALETSIPVYFIFVAIVIGFVVSYFIVKIQASKLNAVKQKVDAADYVGNVILTGEFNTFMYKDVKCTPKPKNDSSSTHTSSSGRTHGGGNKSF